MLLQVPRRNPRRVPVPPQVDGDDPQPRQRLGQHPPARGVRGSPRATPAPPARRRGRTVRNCSSVTPRIVPHHPDTPRSLPPIAGRGADRGCRWAVVASVRARSEALRRRAGPCRVRPGRAGAPVWCAEPPHPGRSWSGTRGARRVMAHQAGPLRVLGGTARGRPRCCWPRVAARVDAAVEPERTLSWSAAAGRGGAAGTAGRAALRRRWIGPPSREPLVRTVHSYAFGVLRLHAARNGIRRPGCCASARGRGVRTCCSAS